ncbi:hypothetical protein [Paraburkholderia sp. JHI869]|uniref:hypothetical protein n=1 Tax=Paraburkholderia sp. JHI869 TaxID=3112959 RepID=UPI00319DF29C
MFYQLEAEYEPRSAARIRWAANRYLQFVTETNAFYPELTQDKRFFLSKYWEADALVRFCKWLPSQNLKSKTRYSLYKSVRQVMDMAYALRIIDSVVYHAPMFIGTSETNQRSAYQADEHEIINASIARWVGLANSVLNGYTPTGLGIPYRPKRFELDLVIDGAEYTLSEASKHFGIRYEALSERLRTGWPVLQAVGLEPRPAYTENVELTVDGLTYPSMAAAAAAYGISAKTLGPRVRKGWTPEQCVGLEPVYVSRNDERAVLWMFENQFECDARYMYEYVYSRGWNQGSYAWSLKKLSALFMRWGVWPYVDDRIVMPLAAELCMLTGLNVESLKELEVDSYRQKHPLTGQPVLMYVKPRSASSTRSAEKELHLPLLEMNEQYLEASVVQRVEKIIGLTLALTEKIRSDAPPEIARKLFIFEDVERSRRDGQRSIVAIDPKGKTAVWYERFCTEEGLRQLLGPNFNFTLARCRPTLATNMVLAGATLFDIQVLLGHASIKTTATYLDERGLQPAFNRTVSEALHRIASRSRSLMEEREDEAADSSLDEANVFHETLSGCGCSNPYSPSKNVRTVTKHIKGTACKYWNMCLRCDRAVVTERSLPKLVLYRQRVMAALDTDSPAIRSRKELFRDAVAIIDGILVEDEIFPAAVIRQAEFQAVTMNDMLVDHLIYQGV